MNHWTKQDYLWLLSIPLCILFDFKVIPLIAYVLPNGRTSTFTALFFIALCPLILSVYLVYRLLHNKKRIWIAAVVLCTIMLLVAIMGFMFLPETARLMKIFTGHYNTEATGFGVLYTLLFTGGLLLGVPFGWLIDRMKTQRG